MFYIIQPLVFNQPRGFIINTTKDSPIGKRSFVFLESSLEHPNIKKYLREKPEFNFSQFKYFLTIKHDLENDKWGFGSYSEYTTNQMVFLPETITCLNTGKIYLRTFEVQNFKGNLIHKNI
jgi:hypothetical protein